MKKKKKEEELSRSFDEIVKKRKNYLECRDGTIGIHVWVEGVGDHAIRCIPHLTVTTTKINRVLYAIDPIISPEDMRRELGLKSLDEVFWGSELEVYGGLLMCEGDTRVANNGPDITNIREKGIQLTKFIYNSAANVWESVGLSLDRVIS